MERTGFTCSEGDINRWRMKLGTSKSQFPPRALLARMQALMGDPEAVIYGECEMGQSAGGTTWLLQAATTSWFARIEATSQLSCWNFDEEGQGYSRSIFRDATETAQSWARPLRSVQAVGLIDGEWSLGARLDPVPTWTADFDGTVYARLPLSSDPRSEAHAAAARLVETVRALLTSIGSGAPGE